MNVILEAVEECFLRERDNKKGIEKRKYLIYKTLQS